MSQATDAVKVIQAVAETIREVGSCPAGMVYAALMTKGCSLPAFEKIIDVLVNSGVVKRNNNMLIWIDPPKKGQEK